MMAVSKAFLAAAREPAAHNAVAIRVVKDGFVKWFTYCQACGKTFQPDPPGKYGAAMLAVLHNETGRWTK